MISRRLLTELQIEDNLRNIIAEVLNDNRSELLRLVEALPAEQRTAIVNRLGHCGESPAHLAIYKDDEEMLRILLSYGAHPHCRNSKEDTLLHTAIKIGQYRLLVMLYETGLCNMEITNKDGLSLLQMSRLGLSDHDLIAMKLFKNWSYDLHHGKEVEETNRVLDGRRRCEEYVLEKLAYDEQMRIVNLTRKTTDWMLTREKTRRILSGNDASQLTHVNQVVEFPEKEGIAQVDQWNQDWYNKYNIGMQYTAKRIFVDNVVSNAVKLGAIEAEKVL